MRVFNNIDTKHNEINKDRKIFTDNDGKPKTIIIEDDKRKWCDEPNYQIEEKRKKKFVDELHGNT